MDELDRNGRPEDEAEINLTPMLDVVFIMLIFFVVTAVFVREPGIEVSRPKAETGSTPASAVYVAISEQNEVWLAGDLVEIDSLRFRLERLRAENPGGGLIIQADADSSNKYTMAVMDAARAAGISPVAIATEQL